MSRLLLALLALVMAAGPVHAAPAGVPSPGPFGRPYGTIVTVEGTAVDGATTREKALEGRLLLRIEVVDGKRLESPRSMEARTFGFAPVALPKAGERFKLVGYAGGHFAGMPSGAFEYVPRVATRDFAFEDEFYVLRDLLKR